MAEKMTLLGRVEAALPVLRNMLGSAGLLNGQGIADELLRDVRAHLAQPAQAVDVGAIKTLLELVEDEHGGGHTEADCRHCVAVNKLTRAIGNAQAEAH